MKVAQERAIEFVILFRGWGVRKEATQTLRAEEKENEDAKKGD